MASYANKAIRNLPSGTVLRASLKHRGQEHIIEVLPQRQTLFKEALWDEAAKDLKEINEAMTKERLATKKEKFYTWISRKEYQRRKQERLKD